MNKENAYLSRSSLRAGHQVSSIRDDGYTVLLHWCRNLVSRPLDMTHQHLMEHAVLKCVDISWLVFTVNCDLDI